MNGAESLIRALSGAGVNVCFANPGTSEMHLVQAIDAVPDMRAVLCLFEGVATGAADGYARMKGLPATTVLHLGAGLGNGIANLHNARRAGTPIINLVGDHAIHHVAFDAPLTSDIEAVAKPVSAWIRTSRTAEGMARDGFDALKASLAQNPVREGQISTLIIPADCAWGEGHQITEPALAQSWNAVATNGVLDAADALDSDAMLLLDGTGLSEEGLRHAGRIAAKTGCRVYSTTFPARVESGPGVVAATRMPYFPEHVLEVMGSVKKLILAGAEPPVSFFAYRQLPGRSDAPSYLVPDGCDVIRLAHRDQDVVEALHRVADALGAPEDAALVVERSRPDLPTGTLTTMGVAQALAALVPDNSIVATDSGGGGAAYAVMQNAVRHTWMNLTGGAIGQGGPAALGAAVACPERSVFALLGDGGAMYTNQFLWTAAREKLDLTTVIYANGQYNILDTEYRRLGVNKVGDKAASLFDLSNPDIDWVALAAALGVPGERAETGEAFSAALQRARDTEGPYLIQAVVDARN